MDRKEELLRGVPFLAPLPDRVLVALAGASRERRIEKDAFLFLDGDEARAAWIVVTGRVAVQKESMDGRTQILHIWEAGDLLGEVALFGGDRYPASAQALEASQVLSVPRDAMVRILKEEPELSLVILGQMAKRLRHLVRLAEGLSLKEVPARLAVYLLGLLEDQGTDVVRLGVSRGRLAGILGTIPETLSRVLGRMSDQGLLEREGRAVIRILDADALREISDGERTLS
ncbi:MAG: Crp/Fnr family transcriptional regulator [Pseudomonadota bacterium]